MFCCAYLIAQQPAATPDWRAVLGWLPTDTQTLIVATQPFVIAVRVEDEDAEISPIDTLRRFGLGRLDDFPPLYEALVGHTVTFALAGVREYRRFSGLGLGPYDGCAVIVFARPLGDRWQSAISGLAKEDWSGHTVFVLSTEREGSLRTAPDQLNLFVTQFGSNFLVTATDRGSLHSLLERRAGVQTDHALPGGLPEWREVDVTAPVWALRHYRHTYDPKTKRSVLSLGPMEEPDDAKAVGLVYNVQPIGPVQKLYYLSQNKQIDGVIHHHWEWKDEGLATPKVRRRAKGVAEVTVPTPSAAATGSFFLLLLSSLGYEIAM